MSGAGGGGGGGIEIGNQPGNLNVILFRSCIGVATGGLLFGYEIGIIGGVTVMNSFLLKFFPTAYRDKIVNQNKNNFCRFEIPEINMFTSCIFLSAIISPYVASAVSRKLGRIWTMRLAGILLLAGSLINSFAKVVWLLFLARILLGFGVGCAHQSVPLYLSEMAPCKYRGALNIGFQLSISVGILIANVLNYFLSEIKGDSGWRLSLVGSLILAVIFSLGSFHLHDTPNSMIQRGDHEGAKNRLKRIRGVDDVDVEFNGLVAVSQASNPVEPWSTLFEKKYRPQLCMAFLIPFFQQLTGVYAILFYALVLFNSLGLKDDAVYISVIITSFFNLLANIVSTYAVDKLGRRVLFLVGGIQMLIGQVLVAVFIGNYWTTGDIPTSSHATVLVSLMCIIVSGFAWSWGPLGWLVPSEIFPLEIRSEAQGLSISVNMLCTFFVAHVFQAMLCIMKLGLFIFYGIFALLMTIFIYYFLPETNGIAIEQMTDIWNTHWYWNKYTNAQGDE